MNRRKPSFVLRIVALYAAGTLLWIVFSDHIVNRFAGDLDEAIWFSQLKGVLFITVSSLLLYLLLSRLAGKLTQQSTRMREVARRYQTLFEHGGEAMLVVGADDGIIHEANHAASQMYGWPIEALVGRPLEQLVATAPDNLSADEAARVAHWHHTSGGERIPVDLVSDAMRWKGDPVHLVVVRHMGDQLAQRAKLSRMAHQDPLTGLLNRNLLPDQARMAMANAQRSGTLLAMCFIDLDGFKEINDRLGHDAGDQLLIEIARRLQALVRGGDRVVRLGGDEFVVLLGELRSLTECEQILTRLLASLAEPVELGTGQGRVTGSIGVALYPQDGEQHEELLRAADEAMYRAKAAGRNRFVFHNKVNEDRLQARNHMLDRVARAIKDRSLIMRYVPIVDTAQGTIVGAEAKMRWRHSVLGVLPAADFLPFINGPVIEHAVDQWAIEQVTQDLMSFGNGVESVRLNLFVPGGRFETVVSALQPLVDRLGADRVTVELSPTVVQRMGVHLDAFRRACQARGIRVSLDGLVAGADSVHALATLGLNEFKLSAEALGLTPGHGGNVIVANAYVALARGTRMALVVKGVGTGEQRRWLTEHGCTLQQGAAFGDAVDAEQLGTLHGPAADALRPPESEE